MSFCFSSNDAASNSVRKLSNFANIVFAFSSSELLCSFDFVRFSKRLLPSSICSLTWWISIISAGIELILVSKSTNCKFNSAISACKSWHSLSFFNFNVSLWANSVLASFNSCSKSRFSRFLTKALISELSSFALLNFLSKNSKSRNLAKISFLFVEPSLMKVSDPSWLAIEVRRKSSTVPKIFRMFLFVSVTLVPLSSRSSSIALSKTRKSNSVLASFVSLPLSFLIYFVLILSTL